MRPNCPFNCWYMAATSDEVGRDLLARRLLGTEVVLYRAGSGDVVAMEDRCVHRAYPLSAGRLDGDRLVCGLHGFVYDPDGTCVDVPSQKNVPRYTIEPGDRPAFELLRVQGFTPETATTTHVFLQIVRNYAIDRAVVADHLRAMFHEWAVRDAAVLEKVQRRLGDEVEPRRD